MARRLTVFVATIAVLVLTSVAIRMFDPFDEPASDLRLEAYRELRVQLTRAQQVHQEAWRAATLTPLLPDSGVVLDLGSEGEMQRGLEGRLRHALAGMPQRVRGGIFLVEPEDGLYAPPSLDSVYSTDAMAMGLQFTEHEIYTGSDERGPFCFVAATPGGLRFYRTVSVAEIPQRVIGGCRWLLRYGPPGAQLSRWLHDGGFAFGEMPAPPPNDSGPLPARNIFGGRVQEPVGHTIERLRCRTGDADACVRSVRDLPPRAGPIAAFQRSWRNRVPWREASLLASMEAEFGAERFERFWRSDEELEAAFAGAFGLSLGEWMVRWTQRHHAADVRGPGVDIASVLLSLLAIGVLLGGAATVAQRRSIG